MSSDCGPITSAHQFDSNSRSCRKCGSDGIFTRDSPLGAAIGYALRNWVALTRYTGDKRFKIDNNGAEQALRPIVLGRKNWLFAGSEAAAHRTAILCSLVQTCKHLQINPFVYLRDVIERVSTHPARLVLELTPREWKRLRLDPGAQATA